MNTKITLSHAVAALVKRYKAAWLVGLIQFHQTQPGTYKHKLIGNHKSQEWFFKVGLMTHTLECYGDRGQRALRDTVTFPACDLGDQKFYLVGGVLSLASEWKNTGEVK